MAILSLGPHDYVSIKTRRTGISQGREGY